MLAQLADISHIFKESNRKCLLTSCVCLSPSTSQIHAITKYDISLYAMLENSSRHNRFYLMKGVVKTLSSHIRVTWRMFCSLGKRLGS
jgi:hypothetical protein